MKVLKRRNEGEDRKSYHKKICEAANIVLKNRPGTKDEIRRLPFVLNNLEAKSGTGLCNISCNEIQKRYGGKRLE